jgi:hypothetical protein
MLSELDVELLPEDGGLSILAGRVASNILGNYPATRYDGVTVSYNRTL